MTSQFAERIIIWVFRTAVDLGFRLGSLDHKRFKKLLDASFYLELQSKGFSQKQMSAAAGVSEASVSGWRKSAQHLWSEPDGPKETDRRPGPVVMRILNALEEEGGSLEDFDLEDSCRSQEKRPRAKKSEDGDSFFQRFTLALRSLIEWGFVEERRHGAEITFHLTSAYQERMKSYLHEPFLGEVLVLDDLIILSAHLLIAEGPRTEASLLSDEGAASVGLPPQRIERALKLTRDLQKSGEPCPVIHEVVEGERVYSLTREARFLPSNALDEPSMYHLSAIRLIREQKAFLGWLATDPSPEQISMQTFMFRVLPDELPGLYREHCEHFKSLLKKAEAKAVGDVSAMLCRMGWMGHVVGGRDSSRA